MLDHDARIVKAGALVPLCKMLLSSLVTTQEYTSGLLRNLVAYNAGMSDAVRCSLSRQSRFVLPYSSSPVAVSLLPLIRVLQTSSFERMKLAFYHRSYSC